MKKRDAGYSLMELVVVIGIFSVVMSLISVSFSRIVASSGQTVKSVETDIGGLIGLELLRIDLEFAGFGLPWSIPSDVTYSEAEDKTIDDYPDTNPHQFNDDGVQPRPPRAFVKADGKGFNGSDYLVLKGTALGLTRTSRRWSYLNYSSTQTVVKNSKSEVELSPEDHETVIVINSGVRGGLPVRDLVTNGGIIYTTFGTTLPEAFQPKSKQDSYLVYGVAKTGTITFPFNRADYYLARPSDISANCAHKDTTHGAGTLYRRPVNKVGTPILDCVADFQVEFLNESGTVTDIDFRDQSGKVRDDAAQQIRQTVKEVRVFILAQQGKKDPGYSYPVSMPDRALVVGDRVWTQSDLESKLGSDWRHYRWKVYTIAVQPKNLE